ncbi:YtoQ family protein [Jannaschia sp. Os4]|uniref:YtoQ family protein n=1 Tax=Jannaschia sp. Os4 TaxID=2807617 RepID=UPI00193AB94D|nr:YtoQ family protein [Jannaschia sp. Os4]MBM2576141.1 YtoQ family protein [Jannaschia sp. Os4]
MTLTVYLAGEIHTDWRDEIARRCEGLDIRFTAPVTDHAASDDCGVAILGAEEKKVWHDRLGAGINGIRTRHAMQGTDVVVVRFGDKYKQWNAAFDAGLAVARGKPVILQHGPDHAHALKEIAAAADAVCETPAQVAQVLRYVLTGALPDETVR